ncbi:TetR/AcrR family transcriptional regulator [Litoribacillus peritrichatus]|uniref:TetR/AcrR family transcriptional regulator n=1 Tax=Litoribacillus peritrichatus TaxID=718191 RepID=A0ABP7MJ73_9GAMM
MIETMSDTNLSRKEREFQRREQDILSAAIALFGEEGWENVTVAQIAASAEIGKGTVYKHFASKEDIYARLSLDFHYQLMTIYQQISLELNSLDFMKEAIYQSFRFYRENQICGKLSEFCKRKDFKERISESLSLEYQDLDQKFEAFFGVILEKGIQEGVIDDRPIMHLMIGMEATFEGAISMMTNDSYTDFSELDEETFVDVVTGFMVSALAKR